MIKQNNTIRKRKNDQRKVRKRIRRDPDFIIKVLLLVFKDPEKPENLYQKLSELRATEKFLDLGLARYLFGNGLIRPVTRVDETQRPQFDFRNQLYLPTKKANKMIQSKRKSQ